MPPSQTLSTSKSLAEVADSILVELIRLKAIEGENPHAARQAIAARIGCVLSAERRYITELLEDMPIIEGIDGNPMEPQLVCDLAVERINQRNNSARVLQDFMAVPYQVVLAPQIVWSLTPDLIVEELLAGNEEDLLGPSSELIGRHACSRLSPTSGKRYMEAVDRLKATDQPQIAYIEAIARKYVVHFQWNHQKTKIIASSIYRVVDMPSEMNNTLGISSPLPVAV